MKANLIEEFIVKLITFLSAGLLALSSLFIAPNSVSAITAPSATATDTPIDVDSSKPSLAELSAAIDRVEKIENYLPYSQLSVDELKATTTFYREYIYLFNLVAKAYELQTNYASASVEDLSDIITAAEDAEIACGYLFGTIRKNSANNPNTGNSSIPSTSTPNIPTTTSQSTPLVTTAVAKTSNTASQPSPTTPDHSISSTDQVASNLPESSNKQDTTSSDSSEIPEIPATGEVAKSNHPLFITIGIVAIACLLVGSMIILNRKKSYHPGRKF